MTKTVSVRKLRTNLAHVLEDVTARMDRYVISKRGQPKAIIMCVDDYEAWLESLSIIGDKKTMDDIKKAREEIKQGKHYSFEEVFGKSKKIRK